MIKRIFAVCDENTYYKFTYRAKSENLTVAQAFLAIVRAYALGAQVYMPKPKIGKIRDFDYREERIHG